MVKTVKENPSLQFTVSEKEKAVCKESPCKLPIVRISRLYFKFALMQMKNFDKNNKIRLQIFNKQNKL